MFQFRRFPTYAYFIQHMLTEYCSAGFPHSDICGSSRMCRSPQLFAACHVLLRLLMPRHSPCALISLTFILVLRIFLNYAGNFSEVFYGNCITLFAATRFRLWPLLLFHIFAFLLPCLISLSLGKKRLLLSSLFSFQGAVVLTSWTPVENSRSQERTIPSITILFSPLQLFNNWCLH